MKRIDTQLIARNQSPDVYLSAILYEKRTRGQGET